MVAKRKIKKKIKKIKDLWHDYPRKICARINTLITRRDNDFSCIFIISPIKVPDNYGRKCIMTQRGVLKCEVSYGLARIPYA